jgi:hypothetical protein
MGMMYERQLAIPAELKEMYPLTAKMNETIQPYIDRQGKSHSAPVGSHLLRRPVVQRQGSFLAAGGKKCP